MTAPGLTRPALHVEIREYPAQDYLGIEFEAAPATVGHSVAAAYSRIFARLAAEHRQPAGPPFLIASQATHERVHLLVGVPTEGPSEGSGDVRPGLLAGSRAAVHLHHGPYEGVTSLYEELQAWLTTHGQVPAGPPREVFLNGPEDVASPADYLTELVWPIV